MLIRHSSRTKLYNCILKNKFLKYGNNTLILLEPLTHIYIYMCDFNISETIALEKLSTLKNNKAPSPDSSYNNFQGLCPYTLL